MEVRSLAFSRHTTVSITTEVRYRVREEGSRAVPKEGEIVMASHERHGED